MLDIIEYLWNSPYRLFVTILLPIFVAESLWILGNLIALIILAL